MKRQDNLYDIIILGMGLGGLIAANHLIQARRRVLLLKEKRFHTSFIRNGYRFIPFSTLFEKRIPTNLLEKIPFQLDRLAKREGGEKPKKEVDFQVILPQARIDLFRDRSLFKREWKREFPDELRAIEAFYQEIEKIYRVLNQSKQREPSSFSFPLRSASSFNAWNLFNKLPQKRIDHWLSPFSTAFKTLIQLQILYKGNLSKGLFPLSLVSYLLNNDEQEEISKLIDFEKVTQHLLERFMQSGGSVYEIDGVEKISVKRREGVCLSLKNHEPMIQGRILVLNIPIHQSFNLFENKIKIISNWAEKIRPQYMIIPYFLGVRETGIPVGIKDSLISLQNLDRGYEDGNLLFMSLSEKGDESEAPEGKRALTVQALMPFEPPERRSVTNLQKGVMDHIRSLFPFLENHLEFVDQTWAENHLDCWSYPLFLYEVNSNYEWRKGLVPIKLSKSLFFVGKENFPYLGLEGEVIGGLMLNKELHNVFN